MPAQSKALSNVRGIALFYTVSSYTYFVQDLNHVRVQVPSIKGRLTLKEVSVLDVLNLSARIQDAYLLWNSVKPIDTHASFNRAIMDGPHVTSEGFEYRWSSCGAEHLKTGVVLVCVCVQLVGLVLSSCVNLCVNTHNRWYLFLKVCCFEKINK